MSESEAGSPLFTKTYDFLAWLTPLTNDFPRLHRHTVTRRLLEAALDFHEQIIEANNLRGQARLQRLNAANAQLDKVRTYWRLAHHWRWISPTQYEHGGRMVAELGRLLGGWQKVTRQRPAA
ncbi:MAG: diversity-generating retroelement protein Avd [Caldilineaceae bacterium]